jgi:hypothetical protein
MMLAPALEYALCALVHHYPLAWRGGAFRASLNSQPADLVLSERSVKALRDRGLARLGQAGPGRMVWAAPTDRGSRYFARRVRHG